MHRPSLMVIHSILEVHADPRRTCPSYDVGGALQLMDEKKIIKKQDSVGTNTNQYYLGEFDCTLFDHHKLPNIDLCKKCKQDCHTRRKQQQESTSRYYIYNTVNISPSMGTWSKLQTSSCFYSIMFNYQTNCTQHIA